MILQLVLLCSAFQVAWLEVNGRRYEVGRGETKIGRDPEACKITLESKVCQKAKSPDYICIYCIFLYHCICITCASYFALVVYFTYFVITHSVHVMIMSVVMGNFWN